MFPRKRIEVENTFRYNTKDDSSVCDRSPKFDRREAKNKTDCFSHSSGVLEMFWTRANVLNRHNYITTCAYKPLGMLRVQVPNTVFYLLFFSTRPLTNLQYDKVLIATDRTNSNIRKLWKGWHLFVFNCSICAYIYSTCLYLI